MATAAAGSSRSASGFEVGWLDSDLFLVVGGARAGGRAGAVDTEERRGRGDDAVRLRLRLRLPGVEEEREGRDTGLRLRGGILCGVPCAVAAMHHRTFLRYTFFLYMVIFDLIHMVITCYI
jgi:hypothetical protein